MSVAPAGRIRGQRIRVSSDVLVLCGLLLLFTVLSYAITGQRRPSSGTPGTEHRSSFSAAPGGWNAFYQLLQKRQNKVSRLQRRPREWPRTAGVVITGPYSVSGAAGQWSSAEAKDALSWVSQGGVLIAFTDAADDLIAALGLRTSEKAPLERFVRDNPPAGKKSGGPAGGDPLALKPQKFRVGPTSSPLSVQQPVLFLKQVSSLKVSGEKRYTAGPTESVTLLADKLPLALAIPYGRGRVYAVSDAGIPDNSHIAQADNARFITQLAEAHTSKMRPTICFDEYHQGYRDTNTFWTAIGRPGQLAFWQMAGLFLLMAYSASRRFGLPRPLSAPSRVSSEYITSLADLYRRARAADAALDTFLKIFWRDLCRAAEMPTEASPQEVALRVAGRASVLSEAERAALADRITATVLECHAKIEEAESLVDEGSNNKKNKKQRIKSVLSEAELLRLVTTIETLRKELELGQRSHV